MAATDPQPTADPKSAATSAPVQPAAGVVDADCAAQVGGNDNGRSSAGTSGPSGRLFVAVLVSLVSPLLFGFCLSFTSPAQDMMLGKITPKDSGSHLVVFNNKSSAEASVFASILTLGCMVGAFGGSALSDRIGRKWTLCLSAMPMILTYGLLVLLDNWMVLSAMRFIMGIGVGAGSAVAPTYLAEVSTASLRGGLGASNQLSITIGVVLTNALGGYMFLVDGTDEDGKDVKGCQWRDLALCGLAAAVVLLLTSLIPESPKFHAKRGDMDKARASLHQLRRDSRKCQSELELLSRECPDQATAGLNALASGEVQQNSVETGNSCGSPQDSQSQLPQSIFAPEYRRSIVAAVGVLISQQMSGVNAIIFYTQPICTLANLDDPKLASLGIMLVQVIFTFLSCFLMDRAGRKVWLLGGSVVMALSMFALMIYFWGQENGHDLGGAFALGALVVYIISFSLGWGPIPWLIQAELFPTCVRSAGTSLGVFGCWVAAFIVTLTFQPLKDAIKETATFGLFGGLIVVCGIFVAVFVPETRGKPAEVVLQELNSGRGRAQRADARDVPLTTGAA